MSHSPATKKGGEIDEIRTCLREPPKEGDAVKKRAALRKVVALMTSGMDITALFPDVVMSCFTTDLVCKKLIYLYLTVQSKGNEELAVLAINALVKECNDESPIVRGLALRSLAAMHVVNLLEYVVPLVEKGLADTSAYVRKTAVCCLLRVYHRSPEDFYTHLYFETAIRMVSDADVQVSANALDVLLEVTRHELAETSGPVETHPPFVVTRSLLYQLLNRLHLLNEWQQLQVIHLCLQYTPTSEEEMFEMMNLLDERLESSNTAVVMACSQVFLHLTQNAPAVQRQVYLRLRLPLLMIASSDTTETAYVALCHMKVLVKRDAKLFEAEYRTFFCTVSEPSCNKCVKMDILAAIVTQASVSAVLEELVAYSEDRNATVARTAIATMGRVTLQLPEALSSVLALFSDFITLGLEDVRGTTLTVLTDVLRQHVQLDKVRPLLQTITDCYKENPFTDEESRLALLWLLGEFGEYMAEAPYLMEVLSDTISTSSAALRLQLLTSSSTLFFKRPPEMHRCLGRVLHVLLNDFSNADVLDRALLYYRLFRADVTVAARVICAPRAPIEKFVEDMDASMLDRLMAEFDSLSVVFGVPQDRFLSAKPLVGGEEDDLEDEEEIEEEEEEREEGVLEEEEQCNTATLDGHSSPSPGSGSGALPGSGMDHLFGDDPSSYAPPLMLSELTLSPDAEMEAADFQQRWSSSAVVATFAVSLPMDSAVATGVIEDVLESRCIFVLAAGTQNGEERLFLYAEATAPTHTWYLVEAIIGLTGVVRVTVKGVDEADAQSFVAVVRGALESVK